MSQWTFLTNHAHALLSIARDPGLRLRDVAEQVGVTERAAQRIVSDLVDAGYLERLRDGRRNSYRVRPDRPLRVAHIMAMAAIPRGFDAVKSMVPAKGGVTLIARSGRKVFAPLDLDFVL